VKVALSGSSGFLGTNLISYLNNFVSIKPLKRDEIIGDKLADVQAVINCAGLAHDLKKVSNSSAYYKVNTEYCNRLFDAFLASDAEVFITISSVKAVADVTEEMLTEEINPNPQTHYGKSKLLADYYIQSKQIPVGKRVYILRPCMIHGPGNKGNLNLIYQIIRRGIPWPLGSFENKRSYCSVENICFVIKELIQREDIPSGIYNVSDDFPISTNQLVQIVGDIMGNKIYIWKISPKVIRLFALLGDFIRLPLNSDRLSKLTENYVVSNNKLMKVIGKRLPVNSIEGLKKTIASLRGGK
jgi:nucleoside-diphosphate-sugar epimerase